MNKPGSDPKVKKTLVRNYEVKVRPSTRERVTRDAESDVTPEMSSKYSMKENVLSEPTLCSSAALANYLSDVKKSSPSNILSEELNVDQGQLCAKMTKHLNFHFNDRIYKNLIELNDSIKDFKTRKEKRPVISTGKKDLEPNIEDFCKDEKEEDTPPKISVIKTKFRPIKTVEDGSLHKLVASFEVL